MTRHKHGRRAQLLCCTAIIAAGLAGHAFAQAAGEAQLSEVVVTAQKRQQNLQDVPISVSAISAETLRANRVAAVMDLSTVAPNLVVHLTAAASAIPAFEMRGVVSYGVAPGSDKEISIYVDGVYLGATRGSSFDLPDVERIEILRGPQGTLFGRNATAGAVSIITRNPPGEFGVLQEVGYGNYDQFRSRTRIDFPSWGPISASVNFTHDERRGDIENLGAGQVWDRSVSPSGIGRQVSPKWLGSKNSDIWFAAVKFEPSDNFNVVYKFDHTDTHYTPEGVTAIGVNPAALGPVAGGLLSTILATQPTPPLIQNTAKRPKFVNNSFATPAFTKVYGHSVTANLQINEKLSVKNILAYRHTYNYSSYNLDGLGGLINTIPALGPVGSPFLLIVTQFETVAKQWSDELQVNYNSKFLTLTAGALYFDESARSGSPLGLPSNYVLAVIPNGVFPRAAQSVPYNYQVSKALYAQAEFHVTPKLDVVGGYRITKDNKSGNFYSGVPVISFTYEKTKPAYMANVNYKPTDDIMIYGKYSFAFVSGGAVGPIAWVPETAKSWEAGLKADFLDKRVRTNLAVFDVKYHNVQSAQGGANIGRPELGTLIISAGDAHAKGFELEFTALPARGVTLGGGLGYTDVKYSHIPALLGTDATYLPTLRPKWTAQIRGEYETQPIFADTRLSMRVDANFRSKERIDSNPFRPPAATSPVLAFSPASWLVNARVALKNIKAPGGSTAELAVWGKNLTDNKAVMFADITGNFSASTSYQSARTFGVDLTLEF